jgi:hypothetical protein
VALVRTSFCPAEKQRAQAVGHVHRRGVQAVLGLVAAAALDPIDAVVLRLIEKRRHRAVRLAQFARGVLQLGAVVSPSTSAASASISCHRFRSGVATVFCTTSGWRTRHSLEKFPNFDTSPSSWKNRSAAMIACSTAMHRGGLAERLQQALARLW